MNAKETFLKSPNRTPFEKMAMSLEFRAAIEASLLTMVQNQPRGTDVTKSWDSNSQLVGAREFISILETIHLPETQKKRDTFPNLKAPEE